MRGGGEAALQFPQGTSLDGAALSTVASSGERKQRAQLEPSHSLHTCTVCIILYNLIAEVTAL